MPAPSLTYTLTNGATADASQVMQNFNDLLNGVTDGTKDLSVNALTLAGALTANGHVNLGNSSSDDVTVSGSIASALIPKADATYALGTSSLGWSGIFLGRNSQRVRILPHGATSATYDFVLPASAGATSQWVINTSGAQAFTNTTTTGKSIDGSADENQLLIQGHTTQSSDILLVEKADGTDLLMVTNTNGTKIRGTTDATPAPTGFVGEQLGGSLARSSATGLISGNPKTVCSASITAGDWDIWVFCGFNVASTTNLTQVACAISLNNNTYPSSVECVATGGEISRVESFAAHVPGDDKSMVLGPINVRLSAASTPVYLVARANFTVSTIGAYGSIIARRRY